MANSIRDQLLQAGLVTEEQITKADNEKKNRSSKHRRNNQGHQNKKKTDTQNTKPVKKKKPPQSDLAKFYQQRTNQERKEKQEEEKLRQEVAKLKKERRQKIGKLIKENAIKTPGTAGGKGEEDAVEEGEIRYNFVVGTSIKYIFVSEEQQQQLAEGKLAITFLGGKKMLIPSEIGKKILEIDPNKIVAMAE